MTTQQFSLIDQAIHFALSKIELQLSRQPDFPHITEGGKWVYTKDGVWTGGFWAGSLWLAYSETKDEKFRVAAESFTERLLERAGDDRNHDLGFMFYPSAVYGWRIAGHEEYVRAAVKAAQSLAGQFNPAGNFIPGWGFFGGHDWSGSVLVDTLMNLPLLVWASENGGDPHLLEVAVAHATTAIRHHLRDDGSVYHVFKFDATSGAPIEGDTYQGLSAESAWSRGQGWAVAGLAMLAGMTGRTDFLEAAKRAASFVESKLASDPIPPWDYDAVGPDVPRDSSAGAITAFGLVRLATVTGEKRYLQLARSLLEALSTRCLSSEDQESVLAHATADLPHGLGIDESTAYGDYYFLKALLAFRDVDSRATR
ncbi:glycoside hydrolase family 88 protein [Caballeronia sp. LjRoot34]|uniref:glycoside hydrolase family 88 protein n=1 Tax=Caballeronia sp. LjRoot34 TaxID=3342325 RepID=UPI003ECEC4B2